jgi:hypothetical protein
MNEATMYILAIVVEEDSDFCLLDVRAFNLVFVFILYCICAVCHP